MEKKDKKNKDEINCLKCKAKFDVWLANSNFEPDVEGRVRKRFYNYCGICKQYKTYEEFEKDKGRSREV